MIQSYARLKRETILQFCFLTYLRQKLERVATQTTALNDGPDHLCELKREPSASLRSSSKRDVGKNCASCWSVTLASVPMPSLIIFSDLTRGKSTT